MELTDLKRHIQEHFRDRLVAIVGSGLSAGEGLPTMGQLESHLRAEVPKHLPAGSAGEWKLVEEELAVGDGLEAALHRMQVSEDLGALTRLLHKLWHVIVTRTPTFRVANASQNSPCSIRPCHDCRPIASVAYPHRR